MTPDQGDPEINDDQEIPNEGLEAEADAASPDHEEANDGESEAPAEGDGSEAQDGQVAVDGPPRRKGASDTIRELRARAQTESEARTRLEQQLADTAARLSKLERPAAPAERELTREELALMTPDEAMDYKLGRATKGFNQTLANIQWQTYETGDKAAFNALKATDPLAARYGGEVEERLQAMRQQGQNVDRERLLTFIIGEKARAASGKAKQKAQANGQRRIAAQTTKPGSQRSDQQGTRGKMSEAEAREKRLENITF